MNFNKAKKMRVRFPNIVSGRMVVGECEKQVMKLPEIQDVNNRIYSELLTEASNVKVGPRYLPRIEGFNCTWISDKSNYGQYVDAQFTFAGSEEKKVMKIIDKYGGVVINVRKDLNQNCFTETNMSGKENEVERVNEILEGMKWG